MARRKRGGRRGFRVGKYVSLGFRIAGALAAASPAINAAYANRSNPQAIPGRIVYAYTGLDPDSGAFNWTQTIAGLGAVFGGLVVGKIGGLVGRRL